MERTRSKKPIFVVLSLMVILLTLTAICLKVSTKQAVEQPVQSFRQRLEACGGNCSQSTLIIKDTTEEEVRLFAEHYHAQYRMVEGVQMGIVSLPEDVSLTDICEDESLPIDEAKLTPDLLGRPCGDTISSFDSFNANNRMRTNSSKASTLSDGSGITVALIDTGLETSETREFQVHLDPRSYNATRGRMLKDCDYDEQLLEDSNGHGTQMAGIIAAAPESDEADAFCGLAPNVNLLVIRCELDLSGNFRQSDVVTAIGHAIACDADIICFSMSFIAAENPFEELTQLAVDSDIVCVASAGNDGVSAPAWPAADENVIGVGGAVGDFQSVYRNNARDAVELEKRSNYGESCDMVAISNLNARGLKNAQVITGGSSASAAAVAGGLAQYMSYKDLKYAEYSDIRASLLASCIDIGEPGKDWYFGFGLLDIDMLLTGEQGTITFDPLTDELPPIKRVFFRGRTLQEIPEPEREYAVLDNWYYDINCLDEYNNLEDVLTQDLTVYAKWENEDDSIVYRYVIENGEVTITQYVGKRRFITIPSEIEGCPVTAIGTRAFAGNTRLRGVVFPETLKEIRESAFSRNQNLLSLTLPKSLERIGEYAFYECGRLGVVGIPSDGNLKSIGNYAFACCGRLSRLDLPAKLQSISALAVYSDFSMTRVSVDSGNRTFYEENYALCRKAEGGNAVVYYPAARTGTLVLPEDILFAEDYAFAYSMLTEVTLPDTFTELGASCFERSRLESISIPDGVQLISEGCFSECAQLHEVSLGRGVSHIMRKGFYACSNLEALQLDPETAITKVGNYAFTYCRLSDFSLFENTVEEIGDTAFAYNCFPSVCLNEQLTKLGGGAFSSCEQLESVTFAADSTIERINAGMFSGCTNLREVHLLQDIIAIEPEAFCMTAISEIYLPSTLEAIGDGVFSDCQNLTKIEMEEGRFFQSIDGVLYQKRRDYEKIDGKIALALCAYPCGLGGEVTMPDRVVEITGAAFAYNHRMTSIELSPNLAVIGHGAFTNCALQSVSCPASLKSIDDRAFQYCYLLRNIALNEGLEHIGQWAFNDCRALSELTIPSTVTAIDPYAVNNDWALETISFAPGSQLHTLDQYAFSSCGIRSIEIPSEVEFLGIRVFSGCSQLRTVTFADNSKLTAIPAWVFRGADQVETITFGENCALEMIQARALENLTHLQSINLDACTNLKNIDNYAFQHCSALQSIRLPDGLVTIGRYAFYGCNGLSEFVIPENVEHIGRYAFAFCKPADILFKSAALPPMLEEYWDYGIKTYTCGTVNTVTSADGLWNYALLNDGSACILHYLGSAASVDLTQVDGHPVVSVGCRAFSGNTTLQNVVLPEGLLSILDSAFEGTTSLESVTIPASLTHLGSRAFFASGISALNWAKNGALTFIPAEAFAETQQLKTLTIPAWIKEIRRSAFRASGIASVSFAAGGALREIGAYAFADSALNAVEIPEGLERIGYHAFENCTALKSASFPENGSLRIDGYAFYHTALQSVTIPAGVQYLGEYCFAFCNELTAYQVAEENEAYLSEDGVLFSRGGEKLLACPAGKTGEYTIPAHVTTLGFGAFEGTQLSSIHFSNDCKVVTIGLRAFYNANALTEITLPESLLSIDYYAFAYCENLERVNIPGSCELGGIYEGAFYHCSKLERFTIPNSVIEISDRAFYACEGLKTVEFGEESQLAGIYDEAFAYTGITDIQIPASVQELGKCAFAHSRLTSFALPETLLLVAPGILEGCDNLAELSLSELDPVADTDEEVAITYLFGREAFKSSDVPASLKTVRLLNTTKVAERLFSGCTGIETVSSSLPVECIGSSAFSKCASLKTIDLGDQVERIESNAFEMCTSLEQLDFGMALKQIGDKAFYKCTSLVSIGADAVEVIGNSAFEDCKLLQIASVPARQIGARAFYNCRAAGISDLSNAEIIGESAFEEALLNGDLTLDRVKKVGQDAFQFKYTSSVQNVRICLEPDCEISAGAFSMLISGDFVLAGTQSVPAGSCQGISARSITIEEGITKIEDGAFAGCYCGVLSLPTTVVEIGAEAFAQLHTDHNYRLPEGLLKIGSRAFYNDSSQYEGGLCFFVPDSVIEIGAEAFGNCYEVYVGADEPLPGYDGAWADGAGEIFWGYQCALSESGVLFVENEEEARALLCCGDQAELTLDTFNGKPVRKIICSAFFGTETLQKVTLGDRLEEIGRNAFTSCDALTTLTAGTGLRTIGAEAFKDCVVLSDFVIPDQNALEEVGDLAFYRYQNTGTNRILKNFSFENLTHLKVIGNSAFNNTRIPAIDLSNCGELETIGESAFARIPAEIWILPDSYCGTIPVHVIDSTKVKDVTIPAGVTEIAEGAFEYNPKNQNMIRKIVFAEGSQMKELGQGAFKNCSLLSEVVLPECLEIIRSNAFANDTKLLSILIPAGVTLIEKDAFAGCNNVVVTFAAGVLPDALEDGWDNGVADYEPKVLHRDSETGLGYDLKDDGSGAVILDYQGHQTEMMLDLVDGYPIVEIAEHAFENNDTLQRVVFSDSIRNVGAGAFASCSNLSEIGYSENASVVLGEEVFMNCTGLQALDLSGVQQIGTACFSGCSHLKTVESGLQLQVIASNAFLDDSALEVVNLQDQVTEIQDYAFYGCRSIREFRFPASLIHVGREAFSQNALTEKDGQLYYFGTILYGNGSGSLSSDFRIRENTTIIADYALKGLNAGYIQTLEIPDHVISIGKYALAPENKRMFLQALPDSLRWIGYSAFSGLKNETIVIPPSVSYMESGALGGIVYLKNLTIPFIGQSPDSEAPLRTMFANSVGPKNLRSVTVTGDVANVQSFSMNNGRDPLKNLTEVIFSGNSTGEVVEHAFQGCSSLKTVQLPSGIRRIGVSAFESCALEELDVPQSVEEIGDYAFAYCNQLSSITLHDGLRSVGGRALINDTALTELVIPQSVTSVGNQMLKGCSSLSRLETPCAPVEFSTQRIGWFFGDIDHFNLTGEPAPDHLKTVIYTPSDQTKIPNEFFKNMTGLELVVVPEETEIIGNQAFYGCTALKTISPMPELNTIGSWAFKDCTKLNLNWANERVEHLHSYAYAYTGLRNLEIPESVLSCIESICYCADLELVHFHCPLSCASYAIGLETPKLKTIIIDNVDGKTLNTIFGRGAPDSLETVILTDKVTTLPEHFMDGITGVTIYCQRDENATGWPADWNNGNKVVYKDSWRHVTFYVDGVAVKSSMQKNSSVIQLPAQSLYLKPDDALNSYTFLGWDVDDNGKVDNLLISVPGSVVKAEAVYSVTKLDQMQQIHVPEITEEAGRTVITGEANGAKKTLIDVPAAEFQSQTEVVLDDVSLTFDSVAADAIRSNATEKGITISVDRIAAGQFEMASAGDAVYGISLESEGRPVAFSDEAGGRATVRIPWKDPVRKTANVHVAYIAENGVETEVPCELDRVAHTISFSTSHFSNYRVTVVDSNPSAACDHSMTDVRGNSEASCTQSGRTGETVCLYCGEVIEADTEIQALGHKTELRNTKNATCTESGYSGDEICTVCGETVKKGETVPATGHDWDAGKITKEATCTEAGEKSYTCQNDASHTRAEEIPALGHAWGDWEVTTPATEDAEGVETRTCSRCDEAETRSIPKLDRVHQMTAVAQVEPTCTETGTKACWKCEKCGRLFSDADGAHEIEAPDVIPALGHDYGAVVTEPTCTKAGYTTYTCSRCGDSYVGGEISSLGHDWGEWAVVKKPTATEPGLKQRVCKNNPSHIEKQEIPATGICNGGENCPSRKFVDVEHSPDCWYHAPVDWAVVNGITAGISEDLFDPTGKCTRSQAVTFLWRAMGKPEPTSTVNPFSDVSVSDWYYKSVLWAVENNITLGVGGGRFDPNSTCNRSQIVTFLWRATGKTEPNTTDNPFSDVSAESWYYQPVLWAVEHGITAGVGGGRFDPDGTCIRSQIVTFLHRCMK